MMNEGWAGTREGVRLTGFFSVAATEGRHTFLIVQDKAGKWVSVLWGGQWGSIESAGLSGRAAGCRIFSVTLCGQSIY